MCLKYFPTTGNGNSFISYAGQTALERIARSQKYTNVGNLLRANIDYVTYHVTVKIRRVERNPGVLDVFAIVMNYSTIDVLPCLKEVVEDALAQLNRNFHERNTYSLLKILYAFTICIRKLTKSADISDDERKETNETPDQAEIVLQSVLEYCRAKEDAERIEEEIAISPEDIESEMRNQSADEFPSSAYDSQEGIVKNMV